MRAMKYVRVQTVPGRAVVPGLVCGVVVLWLNDAQNRTEYLAKKYRNKIVPSLAHTAPAHTGQHLPVWHAFTFLSQE